jgi:hypothetical protein
MVSYVSYLNDISISVGERNFVSSYTPIAMNLFKRIANSVILKHFVYLKASLLCRRNIHIYIYIYISTVRSLKRMESTQPLTKMSARNLPGDKGRPDHKADNLIAIYLENVGASTSDNPMALHGLL